MFLEIFLPALCAVVLAAWVSKPENEAFFPPLNLAVYVAAILTFLRSRWGERPPPKSQPMMTPLDVFSIRNNEPMWAGSAKTLVQALEVMRRNGAGSYFIFWHQTGRKAMYQVDEHGLVRPLEAKTQDD